MTSETLLELQARIYAQQRGATAPVVNFLPLVLDPRNLEAAWERVRRADGANTPGLDGLTCADLSGKSADWLRARAEDVRRGRYQPSSPRWIEVPKDNGRTRKLGILTLPDRVMHAALKQVLEPLLDPHFHPHSFGFRPGRSATGALEDVLKRLGASNPPSFRWAVHLDVADCFDTLDHEFLLARLARFVADADALRLLEKILAAGGAVVRRFWRRGRACGVVQGSALSPLLCNLYLHPLDEALDRLGAETGGGACALRYADDLLILARDRALARHAYVRACKTLRGLRQKVRRSKTTFQAVAEGFEWLGVRVQPRRRGWTQEPSFGYVIPDAKVRKMLDRAAEMTTPPSSRIDAGAFDLARWIVSINDQLREWRQAYLYADNAPDVFRALDDHVRGRVAELLHAVTGLRYAELRARFRVQLPRGFWSWQVDGARLAVLSALAPHSPYRLTRRPLWQRGPRLDAPPTKKGNDNTPAAFLPPPSDSEAAP